MNSSSQHGDVRWYSAVSGKGRHRYSCVLRYIPLGLAFADNLLHMCAFEWNFFLAIRSSEGAA